MQAMQAQPTPAWITFRIPGTKNYLHQGWLGLAYWKLSVLGWSRLLVLQHWSLSVCSMDRMERVWLARLRERLLSRLQGHFAGHALLENSYYANWRMVTDGGCQRAILGSLACSVLNERYCPRFLLVMLHPSTLLSVRKIFMGGKFLDIRVNHENGKN